MIFSPERRDQRGFTLIELLVVVVVLGVLAGVVVLGFVGADKEQNLRTEARRLALLIELARDEALQRNEEWGVYIARDGYAFAVYDELRGNWVSHTDRRFRERTIEDMSLAVTVDQILVPGQVDADRAPEIMIFSSGEQTPFEIELQPAWEAPAWLIQSDGLSRTRIERDS